MTHLAKRGDFGRGTIITNSFFVSGKPVTQGSLSFFNGRAVHQHAGELKRWRTDIANSCKQLNIPLMNGAVEVDLTFVLRKPKSVKRATPHVRPDIDKLCRAVLDGLTSVAFIDDAQVIKLSANKTYGDTEGVFIRLVEVL